VLDRLTRQERDEVARRHIDSAEAWMRRIIHERLSAAHGPGYATEPGVLPRKVRDWIQQQNTSLSARLPRTIDATSFDQAIDVLLNPDLYNKHFRIPLNGAYPDGSSEARTFLTRIRDIRNDLAHGRGCSARSLEQAICYSNDLIFSISEFYREEGMGREYDVPLIVRFVDNLGNENHLIDVPLEMSSRIIDMRRGGLGDLRPGQTLIAEVDVDSSFDRAGYTTSWRVFDGPEGRGGVAQVPIQTR